MPTAGPTLRIERLRANLSATAVATEMGVSRMTLYVIEKSAQVEPERVTLHRKAVKTLRDAKEAA